MDSFLSIDIAALRRGRGLRRDDGAERLPFARHGVAPTLRLVGPALEEIGEFLLAGESGERGFRGIRRLRDGGGGQSEYQGRA